MYAEAGLSFPYFQNYTQEVQHLEEFCRSQQSNASMMQNNLVQASTISEYDLGGEGDLFKAPEPIIEEPLIDLVPMTSAISMISCGDDISSDGLQSADIESIQNEQLWSEVFYDCKNDLLAKEGMDTHVADALDIKIPVVGTDESQKSEEKMFNNEPMQKSVSSGCLNSVEWINGAAMRPNFLDFPGIDFGVAYKMRRAFSEGDIKDLGSGNMTLIHSPHERPLIITTEERREKLSRYRNKKTKRNFGRKIKYACRKALADTQPRIRGRFAKTDDSDVPKTQELQI